MSSLAVPEPERNRATRLVWGAALATIGASAVTTLIFVLFTITHRIPYWGEAEVVFEARRLHDGYPLFIDPIAGAHEYGEPPSRYFVTYPPLLSALLACIPPSATLFVARTLSTIAWFGGLAWMALTAKHKRLALAAALFVGGVWVLANFAMVGRPDSVACLLAMIGLTRTLRRDDGMDAIALLCLVLVPWFKPTIVGLPVAAIVSEAIVRRRPRNLVVAAVLTMTVAGTMWVLSDREIFRHVVQSNAQPLTLAIWLENVPPRLPFFAPLFLLAAWHGWRARAYVALATLGGAVGWTLIAIAKTGSSANYWMEPCVAAIALLAHTDGPFDPKRLRHAALALAAALYTASASIGASLEHLRSYRREAAFLATVRERCNASATDVIASDEQGIELALNGRILVPAWQMAWLVREGKFPAEPWIADLGQAKCYVARGAALRHAPAIESAVRARFVPLASDGELQLLIARH